MNDTKTTYKKKELDNSEKLIDAIRVAMTPKDKNILKIAAKNRRMDLSNYVREILFTAPEITYYTRIKKKELGH